MQFVPLGQIPITKTKAYSIKKQMLFFLNETLCNLYPEIRPSSHGAKKKIHKKKKQTLKQKIKKKNTVPLEKTAKNQLPQDLNDETTTLQKTKVFPPLITMLFHLIPFPRINNNKTKKANKKIPKK